MRVQRSSPRSTRLDPAKRDRRGAGLAVICFEIDNRDVVAKKRKPVLPERTGERRLSRPQERPR